MSRGRIAVPDTEFSTQPMRTARRTGRSACMMSCARARTLAAPPMSFFMCSIPLDGFRSSPPVSKQTPLPHNETSGCVVMRRAAAPMEDRHAWTDAPSRRRQRRRSGSPGRARRRRSEWFRHRSGVPKRWRRRASSTGPSKLAGVLMRSRAMQMALGLRQGRRLVGRHDQSGGCAIGGFQSRCSDRRRGRSRALPTRHRNRPAPGARCVPSGSRRARWPKAKGERLSPRPHTAPATPSGPGRNSTSPDLRGEAEVAQVRRPGAAAGGRARRRGRPGGRDTGGVRCRRGPLCISSICSNLSRAALRERSRWGSAEGKGGRVAGERFRADPITLTLDACASRPLPRRGRG